MDFILERKTNRRPRQSSSCGGVASGEDGMWRARWKGLQEGASARLSLPPNTGRMHVRARCCYISLRGSWLPHRLKMIRPQSVAVGDGDCWNHWHAAAVAAVAVTHPDHWPDPAATSQCIRGASTLFPEATLQQEVQGPSDELRGPGWKVHVGTRQMTVPCCWASPEASTRLHWAFLSICRRISPTADPVKPSRMCERTSSIHPSVHPEGFYLTKCSSQPLHLLSENFQKR